MNVTYQNLSCARTQVGRLALLLVLVFISGCGSFGTGKLANQLQSENERLLAEYRAQRDQLTKRDERIASLEARLSESEKMLARQVPLAPTSRLSRLDSPGTSFGNGAGSYGAGNYGAGNYGAGNYGAGNFGGPTSGNFGGPSASTNPNLPRTNAVGGNPVRNYSAAPNVSSPQPGNGLRANGSTNDQRWRPLRRTP